MSEFNEEDFVEATITSWKLSITWSDGKVEGLASCLPEYIYDELLTYFRELETLRAEHDADMRDEPYNFEDDEWKGASGYEQDD
jgi:hypothetical protein